MKAAAFCITLIVSFALLQTTVLPQVQTVDTVLAQMEKSNTNYPYIQAKIESKTYTAFVNVTDDPKTGKIWISHMGNSPRQIKIDFEKPFRELMLIDKGKFVKYSPNTKNGTSFSFSKEDQAEAECIVLGLCQSVALIKQSYTITLVDKADSVPGVKTTVLDLTPKEKKRASLIKSIRLWLDSSKWYPIQTRVYTPNGNYRNSIFTEITVSPKPFEASVFELKPPKDADIQVIKELKF
jgi:outer membrane lipoprotein-sorting protein